MSYKPITLLWWRRKPFPRGLNYLVKIFFNLALSMACCWPVFGNSPIISSEKAANFIQQRVITGNVVDQQDKPISGATVLEKGTNNRVATDQDGSFEISISKEGSLVVSYVGYLENTVATEGKNSLHIILQEDHETIEDV